MRKDLRQFKSRALARPEVKREYDRLAEEFEFLDEILKARASAGLSQADVAARIGTTQSAVARLESSVGKHSPSIATLQRYASALGYRLQVRLVKGQGLTRRSTRTPKFPRKREGVFSEEHHAEPKGDAGILIGRKMT